MADTTLILVATMVAIPRLFGAVSNSHQAIVNILVSYLVGAYVLNRDMTHLAVLIGRTAVEMVCFFFSG